MPSKRNGGIAVAPENFPAGCSIIAAFAEETNTNTSDTKSFLYKTRFHDLLKVEFYNDKEEMDSVGYEIRDINEWIRLLKNK